MGKALMQSMAIFTEAFNHIHITEEDLLVISNRIGFIHLFDGVKDFREPWKVKYKLQNLLMLIFLVKLTEKTNSFYEIAIHIQLKEAFYSKYGLIEDHNCPSHDTLRRVMTCLDASALQEQTITRFYAFLRDLEKEIEGDAKYRHLALDGKEMRGSGRSKETEKPSSNVQILHLYDSGLATCIFCEPIDEKTNEIPVGQNILDMMTLKKTVITADALHCQKETASVIRRRKGDYVLAVKDNQKLLRQEIIDRMGTYPDKLLSVKTEDRDFGILLLPKGYAVDGFTGLKAFVKMTSRVRKSPLTMYFITSTTDEDLICDAIESRWSIENDLHREKDVYFNEDAIRYTNKNAVHNMAIMNNLALQLIRIYQMISACEIKIAKLKMHHFPIETISAILAVMESDEIIKKLKSSIRKTTRRKD